TPGFNGVITLVNSIVAGNQDLAGGGADCRGPGVVSDGFNLFGAGGGCRPDETDISIAPAALFSTALAPLADYGGPTLTHALLPGSPAIDSANPSTAGPLACEPADQRGLPRPQDGLGAGIARCDIGAFEQQTPLPGALT